MPLRTRSLESKALAFAASENDCAGELNDVNNWTDPLKPLKNQKALVTGANSGIGEACALLSGTARPIAHIAGDVGYDSLANFNRQFKAAKGMTPRAYRAKF